MSVRKAFFLPYLLTLILLCTIGCDQVDELTKFDIAYDTSITIPSSTVVDLPIDIATPDIRTNSESTFSSNNTREDLVESIVLTEMELTVTSPASGDFSFLKSITIYIQADGLPETEIASRESIPDDVGGVLTLDTTGEDLKAYIQKEQFRLRVVTVTDEVIGTDHEINVGSVFAVDAKILGI